MKIIYKIISAIVFLFLYIIIINIWAYTTLEETSQLIDEQQSILDSGTTIKLTTSDSTSVSIKRPRWYGTIFESNGSSMVKLFNFISLPLDVNGFNYAVIHILVFILSIIALILI